jgi:hypothetical protein
VKVQKIRKNDEKRRFRSWTVKNFKKSEKMMRKDVSGGQRSKFKKSEKMMRNDVSGGGVKKIRKNDEKRHFRSWRGKISKNTKK